MKLLSFDIIGIQVRTTNQNGQFAQDIPALWQLFFQEGILEKIPNKIDDTIYGVYVDYENGNHEGPYKVIIGCRVASLATIPEGMVGRTIPGGNFKKFTARGSIPQGSVYNEWCKIWDSDLKRSYIVDYEVYNEKAQNPENAEVDIFIAI